MTNLPTHSVRVLALDLYRHFLVKPSYLATFSSQWGQSKSDLGLSLDYSPPP